MDNDDVKAADTITAIVRLLAELGEPTRKRVITSINVFYGTTAAPPIVERTSSDPTPHHAARPNQLDFSSDYKPSAKEFIAQKQPKTDVERIACLAYYLTHFRDTPYFQTLDLAKLNTEAAQPKFSNTAYSATNASNAGYLAAAPSGKRQISAAGEQFVIALPDREAAKNAITRARRRKNSRKKK